MFFSQVEKISDDTYIYIIYQVANKLTMRPNIYMD